MTMNITGETRCETCLISHGFSSADRRSIIIMVVLTSFILAACYVGVLWYAIRTRFVLVESSSVIVHNNEAFDREEEEEEGSEEYVQPVTTTSSPQVRFAVKNELTST